MQDDGKMPGRLRAKPSGEISSVVPKVSLMLQELQHTTAKLLALQAALSDPSAQGWTLRLSESERKDGAFESSLLDTEHYAVVKLLTAPGCAPEIRFLRMKVAQA